jgi:hypothetical protein
MFTRCIAEPHGYEEQVQDIMNESFFSEFQASQECWSTSQILDYDQLVPSVYWANLSTDIYRNHHEVQFMGRTFYEKAKRLPIIFPTVQRKKNVSRETAEIYNQHHPNVPIEEVTTSHLQKHYFFTGEKIGGSCEMRRAWKYNDLKPRFYYCIGGKSYWPSCYIKKIAQILMESIPSTTVRRRRDLSKDMDDNFEEYYATTWDFKAFTTRLSELKYFLYSVACSIEEYGDVTLQLFDYQEGIIDYPLSDLLHEYNEAINNQDTFTIFRLQEIITSPNLDFNATYYQQNSGMLGIPGNIGFSTALHGFEICRICGRDNCACVGDDGFALSYISNNTSLLPHLSQIGIIVPDKSSELPPGDPGPMRYTKRALYRSEDNRFRIDNLLTFPLAAIIDGKDLPFHTPLQLDEYKRRKTFAVSTSSLLWDVLRYGEEISDVELDLLRKFLHEAYNMIGLPKSGALPGYSIKHIGKVLFAIPSIDFSTYDPRTIDWLEFAFDQTYTYEISIPLVGEPGITTQIPLYGEEIVVARHPIWKILEDLEIVEIEVLSEAVQFMTDDNRRRLRSIIKTSHAVDRVVQMIRVSIVKDVPESFHSLFVPLPVVDVWPNLQEILAEI